MANELEGKMKFAIAAADFDTAQHLVLGYGNETLELLASAATTEEREAIIGSFRDVLSLARVVRAHVAAQLALTTARAQYRTTVPERHSFQIDC